VNGTVAEIRRGWAAVAVEKDGKRFWFLSTRLEPLAADVQRAQSLELARVAAGLSPTILVGDLSSEIQLPSSPGYEILLNPASGLNDAVADAGAGFPSCCRDVLLADPAARLEHRTDFVLTSRHFQRAWGSWVNGNGTSMVNGLWPAPHAGILAGIVLPD
jgi:endonuclease/exonuclease/phosphatase family metal-dependent hydrolase